MKSNDQKHKFDVGRTLTSHTNSSGRAARQPAGEVPPALYADETGKGKLKRLALRTSFGLLALIIAAAVVIGAWDAINVSRATKRVFGTGNLFGLIGSSGLVTDPSSGRVNVLIAGYSVDDPGHSGADLTDSILLLSMNPAKHTGYMLSIPRDLYVAIPGFGHGKINEVYKDGGMNLLVQVVENDFNAKIGYWALVDYGAVRDIVNAVGGVSVTINSPDGRLYDPNRDFVTGGPLVDLTNGTHRLNGEQALDLSRARGDPSPYGIPVGFEQSDFQRTADQRMIIKAIKAKLSWKLILNPRKNNQILSAMANNIRTDMTIGQVRPLFSLFNSIPDAKLHSLSLRDLNGKNYLASTYYEGDTLSPAAGLSDFSQINSALSQINQN